MMNDYDRKHLGEILAGQGDWFNAHLLRLIAKADQQNRARLRLAFPEEVKAWEDWMLGRYGHTGLREAGA